MSDTCNCGSAVPCFHADEGQVTPPTPKPEKPRIRYFRCPHCTVGFVVPTACDGRFFIHREIYINLPLTVYVPRCGSCKTDLFDNNGGVEQVVRAALEAEYVRHEKIILTSLERLRRRRGDN